METLTRVLARHVYDLDLTNLPLDKLNDQKSKRSRRIIVRTDMHSTSSTQGDPQVDNNVSRSVCRQDSSLPDGNVKKVKLNLARSYSESNLSVVRRRGTSKQASKPHRSKSLEAFSTMSHDTESTDRTRSPSPAPSNGIENTSIKDSPIQLDVFTTAGDVEENEENKGVVCGGSVRGWLPDVAVILWKRMLGALGDVNKIADPKLHAQVFDYLIKLTETLIKIKENQGVSLDNMSTPQAPELVPPLTIVVPWCFGALCLSDEFEAGKLNALRLIVSVIRHCDSKYGTCLPQFYCFMHSALTSTSKSTKNIAIKYLGPRFLSLRLPGSGLLLLDLINACNSVLSTHEKEESSPRTEAVSILVNLLSLPEDLSSISVLEPEQNIAVIHSCPDLKVSVWLRSQEINN